MNRFVTRCVPLVVTSLAMLGCTAFTVHEDEKSKPGVPFYIKKGAVKQTTVYSRSWYRVTIEEQLAAEQTGARTQVYLVDGVNYDETDLRQQFQTSVSEPSFEKITDRFKENLHNSCKEKPAKNCPISDTALRQQTSVESRSPTNLLQMLESNRSEQVTLVDYNRVFYFNTTVPAFGTAAATAKLASDGTLTEATSSVDATKLADLLPLKELLVDKLGISPEPALEAVPQPEEPKVKATLSVIRDGYTYTFTRYLDTREIHELAQCPPLAFDHSSSAVVRSRFGDKKTDGKKEKNAIGIEGSIVLPDN